MIEKKEIQNCIILDANFILLPAQFKIDYIEEIKHLIQGKITIIVFQQIFDELHAKQKRIKGKIKFEKQLQLGKLYLEQKSKNDNIHLIDERKNPDETTDSFLIRRCMHLKKDCKSIFLASNDKELRKKAHEKSINTIFLRAEKQLCVDGT